MVLTTIHQKTKINSGKDEVVDDNINISFSSSSSAITTVDFCFLMNSSQHHYNDV